MEKTVATVWRKETSSKRAQFQTAAARFWGIWKLHGAELVV